MQLLSFMVIGSVIQADCIKAISAKWNMCPVNAAHSLFIRLLTSETNLKKKQSCLWPYGSEEHSLMSSRGCAARWFILNVINLSLCGRLRSPLRERERCGGVYDWERGKVYQELGCFTFGRVSPDKPWPFKFKADSMWSFIAPRVIMNGNMKSLWFCHNWASLLWMSSRCPLRTNAFTTAIKILLIAVSFQE